ncbi:MAG TPA: glycosyltransferase family 2 protein [Puia sp.]
MENITTPTPSTNLLTKTAKDPKVSPALQMDIITITWNDQKWFPNYLDSLIKQKNVSLKNINLVVVDNNSREENFQVLLDCREKAEAALGSFTIMRQSENLGFARACNVGAFATRGDLVFFLNIDTELEEKALYHFYEAMNRDDDSWGAWEFRQFPYEHPKIYNPVTGEISWASGAALMVKRSIFDSIGGFDTNFYMYTDDVDISWRIRLEGYKIKYLPKCIVYHYSYQSFNDVKPLQYYYSIINNLQLRFKFGTWAEIREGVKMVRGIFDHQGPFENSRKKLIKLLLTSSYKAWVQRRWFMRNKKKIEKYSPHKFVGFDYEERRMGDFIYNEKPNETPLVSVIVRTVNRPDILRETLISLRNQTYNQIEVIVVEDGPRGSGDLLEKEFGDLRIRYYCTHQKVGRTKAGNLGLELATGQYLCFLDDDDLLYADHFEVLIRQLERNPSYKIIHNFAFEAPTKTISKSPYKYTFKSLNTIHQKRFNAIRLCQYNYLPIQTVLFHRDVYKSLGGFDEEMDMLEDWNLWMKYASKFDFYTVFKTCSIYKVPADKKIQMSRQMQLDDALQDARRRQEAFPIQFSPARLVESLKNISI